MNSDDDAMDALLSGLPERDVDPWRRESLRLRMKQVLEAPPRESTLWDRVLEPALVTAVAGAQLVWAFSRAAEVLLGG